MKRLGAALLLLAAACTGADGPGAASPVRTINVNVTPPSIVVGGSARAAASLLDAQGNALLDRTPVWTSLTPAVATVSQTGGIVGLQAGTATVRATDGTVKGDAIVTVHNSVATSVVLSRDTATVSIPNGAVQLIVIAKDVNGTVIANPAITWQSTAPLIATVTANGARSPDRSSARRRQVQAITSTARRGWAQTTVTVVVTPNAAAAVITPR